MIGALIGFIVKHFVCDFLLQRAYQYMNKGIYGHPGGVLHAGVHAAGTLVVCVLFGLPLWFAIADAVIHYHIDWVKVNVTKRYGWKADNSEYFWYAMGLDQTLHYLTYAWFLAMAF